MDSSSPAQNAIRYVVVAAIVLYSIKRSASQDKRSYPTPGGPTGPLAGELKYEGGLKFAGVAVAALAVMVLCVLLFGAPKGDALPLLFFFAALGALAVFMLGNAFFAHGTFDEQGIVQVTPWSGEKRQKWSNLRNVTHNASFGVYDLNFKDGTKIRLSKSIKAHVHVIAHVRKLGHEPI